MGTQGNQSSQAARQIPTDALFIVEQELFCAQAGYAWCYAQMDFFHTQQVIAL